MSSSESQEKTTGYRLSCFLEKVYAGESHSSKSRKFGFPNTTVLEWENGRAMPEEAYKRLIELGCNLTWLLTGSNQQSKQTPPTLADESASPLFSSLGCKELLAIKAGLLEQVNRIDQLLARMREE